MICQGWRRLGEIQKSLRRPYYQMLTLLLAALFATVSAYHDPVLPFWELTHSPVHGCYIKSPL